MTAFFSQPNTYPSEHHWQLLLLDPSWQGDKPTCHPELGLYEKQQTEVVTKVKALRTKSSRRALWVREWWIVHNERCLRACADNISSRSNLIQIEVAHVRVLAYKETSIHQKENRDVIWRISRMVRNLIWRLHTLNCTTESPQGRPYYSSQGISI